MNGDACDPSSGCITCGDEGIPVHVVEAGALTAVCIDADGLAHEVATDLIEGVEPGTTLLIHAGVAIAVLDGPHAARATVGGAR